ncbi:bifunctional 5-dehydro-2-deoxygluconokinase/5-dehydro-2-deoxyphosphogluconate aldolase [Arenibaculum pallidiluteum]|uniref:bifunctional 5-dehydro-2-deoxygluconokinase/5-dehydro-2- deoxyphosphogluconate aldolase n=1 Tax=Arenibaculum pallidiluteum TaxID=2812559 RepID=UPI001A97C120|nr:5-dehydro-2-deoxygluconokinase [Arenibaculum pallidiluteum]
MPAPQPSAAKDRSLDVITIGRSSVDLYGEQVGGRLEDMTSFAKYIGGCPANIAVGAARLGLRPALVTRVGDEHMGRFLREELVREGVDVSHVRIDPERLTALVILGIRSKESFPLIFYRTDCADAAMTEEDVDAAFIASARAVVVTGTHFSRPNLDAASRKAMLLARESGGRVVLDIDYRPVLWGVAGHGAGEERFVEAGAVSRHLQTILPGCDLIVGTEEEVHIAGGSTDTRAALLRMRELAPGALIVLKRGPMGCIAYDGPIPEDLEDGIRGPGFPVEVYNVLGAGDAFMAGFLRGWLRGEPIAECCRLANACGAFAVSRHGCAPAVPTWTELRHFLAEGSAHPRLREDAALEHLHRATTRRRDWPRVMALAVDHRVQFEEMAARAGAPPERISAFKALAVDALRRVQARRGGEGRGRGGLGILLDGRYGQDLLDGLTGGDLWIGRPIEAPGSRPLRFDGMRDLGSALREWPAEHVVKCLCFYHPDDAEELRALQDQTLLTVDEAARRTGHELLLEIIPTRGDAPAGPDTLARALAGIYALGIRPDWWKLPPPADQQGWDALAGVVSANDPHCRGVLVLGLDAPEEALARDLALAARQPLCRGFAVGRTIFGEAASAWLAGRLDDAEAVSRMAEAFGRLVETFEGAADGTAAAQAAGEGA